MTEAAEATRKVVIRPDVTKMVVGKAPGGGKSYHSDDVVGHALAGLTLVSVKFLGEQYGIRSEAYEHLNVGQQRMAIGSRLRRVLKEDPAKEEGLKEVCASLLETQEPAAKRVRKAKVAAAPATGPDEESDESDEDDSDE